MKHLFSALLLGSASILCAAAPRAAQPSVPAAPDRAPPSIERQQLGRQFIAAALPADRYMEIMRTGVVMMATAAMELDDETKAAEAEKDVDHFLKLAEPKIRERLPNLFEAYAQAYAREFSADELNQMVVFAKSPAGQHYLERRLAVETDPAVRMQQEGFNVDLMPILEQMQKEKCAAKAAKRVAMGEKNAKCPLASKPDVQAG